MRKMLARWRPFETFDSPAEAIRAGQEANSKLRTLSDDQVRGKVIQRFIWDDATLVLELDDGKYLNFVAQAGKVVCSLDQTPAAFEVGEDSDVLLEVGGSAFEWHRADLARQFIGKSVEGLWFSSREEIFIYAGRTLLACYLMDSFPEGKPWLFWCESE
jgi:hypothetical protein